jgi:putative phosphoesterase
MPSAAARELRLDAAAGRPLRIAVLADTHGLLRPRVLARIAGCDLVLHAGDVGDAAVLRGLEAVAPVWAVRGNVDGGELAKLPAVLAGSLGGVALRMTHARAEVEESWLAEAGLVVFGHSHRPELEWRGGCLLLNPGGCGPRRFRLPLTVGLLGVAAGRVVPEILEVE